MRQKYSKVVLLVEDKLLTNTRQKGDCIESLFSLTKIHKGYPRIEYQRYKYCTHILAWALINGDVPEDKQVNHTCNNTRCIKIEHLYLGTQKDNMHQASIENRMSRHGGSKKLDPDYHEDIRAAYAAGTNPKKIAWAYNVSWSRIYQILNKE